MSQAANPERGEVLVRLGGKVHRLRPTYAAIVEVRKETGVPLGESFRRVRNYDVVEAATIIGAVMRANGQKVTNEAVGEMILKDGLSASMEEICTLLEHMLTGGVKPGVLGEAKEAAETERSPSVVSSASR